SDDMVVVRGINVFPAQVAAVITGIDALSGEYRILLEGAGPYDILPVEAEVAARLPGGVADGLAEVVAAAIKRDIGVGARGSPVPFGALPRAARQERGVIRKDR